MALEDKELYRRLMQELTRRQELDFSDARTTVARGVAYIGGVIRPQAGVFVDLKEEMKILMELTRKIPGMRDVVIDARVEVASRR